VKLQALAKFRHQVVVGEPLLFGICDEHGRLLLASGQVIQSAEQLEELLERGAFVDQSAQDDAESRISTAKPTQLARIWDRSMEEVGQVLRATAGADFPRALERASKPVLALIVRDPDLALFQVVRQEEGEVAQYASRHAIHAGIAAGLAARRLGWDETAARCSFRAALTMNVSIVELQNRLCNQVTPLTPMQREQLRTHPERSAEMLRKAGVTDSDWIAAVVQHHGRDEVEGRPRSLTGISEIARLVCLADIFTAKLSPRATRPALAPDIAARQLFTANQADSMTAALIKEFGIYPPGTAVRLKSGEKGVVVKRGESANAPLVLVLTSSAGDHLITPLRRYTTKPEHAIAAVIPFSAIRVRIGTEKLMHHLETGQ
jgi:HD-GYP domain-containing protein (c-di-GMP phosphodiesterase class II)